MSCKEFQYLNETTKLCQECDHACRQCYGETAS